MNKIDQVFQRCRAEGRAALIIFCSCGFPDMARSEAAIARAIESGADIIELGLPFSDPMADGPVIRQASEVALRNGANLEKTLAMAARLSTAYPQTAFVLFSYMNLLYNYGLQRLCDKLPEVGIDGILAVDLPFEEKAELELPAKQNGLCLIPLLSPVTPEARSRQICAGAAGFVYSVNVLGVTGVRELRLPQICEHLHNLKQYSPVPVATGFGVKDAQAAAVLAKAADGVIVGSAFVRLLAAEGDFNDNLDRAGEFIRSLAECM
ncbi:MAG: tryptophan synthase subunit alpha [Lentisphaeria bacterium]|jgi:tryptophan synthase alpha chain|nr:tryptophan synthase subunit alpha [Lentisphaerota bacterium]